MFSVLQYRPSWLLFSSLVLVAAGVFCSVMALWPSSQNTFALVCGILFTAVGVRITATIVARGHGLWIAPAVRRRVDADAAGSHYIGRVPVGPRGGLELKLSYLRGSGKPAAVQVVAIAKDRTVRRWDVEDDALLEWKHVYITLLSDLPQGDHDLYLSFAAEDMPDRLSCACVAYGVVALLKRPAPVVHRGVEGNAPLV